MRSFRFDLLLLLTSLPAALFLFLFLFLTNKKFMANMYNSAKEGVDTNDVLSFPTGMVNRQLLLQCLLQVIDLTTLHLGRNSLTWPKSKLATNLARVSRSVHSMIMFWYMSDLHLRGDGDETKTETLPSMGSCCL